MRVISTFPLGDITRMGVLSGPFKDNTGDSAAVPEGPALPEILALPPDNGASISSDAPSLDKDSGLPLARIGASLAPLHHRRVP